MKHRTVAVVMATFNGELFIKEQLSSILNQTYSQLKVYISDDGSSDETINIIKDYANKDERIIFLGVNEKPGVVKNFNRAFLATNEDLVFVSDQDDFWPEDRVEKMLCFYDKMKANTQTATLIFTDMTLVDSEGKAISNSFYSNLNIDPEYNKEIKYLTWRCTSYGCTMLVNRELLSLALPFPDDKHTTMHDNWLILCAANAGNVYYMDYASVYYRQHNYNHTGGMKRSFLQKVVSLRKQLSKINDARIKREAQNKEIIFRKLASTEFIQSVSVKNKFSFFIKNMLPYKKERKIYRLFYFVYFLYS